MPATAPRPPFLPKDATEFANHVANHPVQWFEYCANADRYIDETKAALLASRDTEQALQVESLYQQTEHLRTEIVKRDAIIEYQKLRAKEKDHELVQIAREKPRATETAAPAPSTPASSMSDTTTAQPTRQLSERLPDPDRFEGDRKDLRRFISQIHEKMNVNRDRFPTPQSRMTYVNNRLKGAPYAQILPHIKRGICQLNDYEDILDTLERAFGDPNRVNNARKELFRLQQNNREFSVFFAEFQRLALEGEMSEESLPTLLEQSINQELKGMLVHNQPPAWDYQEFAKFLQELENRRQYYENSTRLITRNYSTTAKPITNSPPRVDHATSPPRPARSFAPQPAASSTDAMDLSSARQYGPTRRERGECFRCGSKEHMVRNCPHPDNRPFNIRSVYPGYNTPSSIESESTAVSEGSHCQSPDLSEKGVSLA